MRSRGLIAIVGAALGLAWQGGGAMAQTAPPGHLPAPAPHHRLFGHRPTGTTAGSRVPFAGAIIGNKRTHVYHLAGAKGSLPAEKNRAGPPPRERAPTPLPPRGLCPEAGTGGDDRRTGGPVYPSIGGQQRRHARRGIHRTMEGRINRWQDRRKQRFPVSSKHCSTSLIFPDCAASWITRRPLFFGPAERSPAQREPDDRLRAPPPLRLPPATASVLARKTAAG